jgi:Ran GTPase-activating protein (RanGAP) involved in mRNA processing and transport
LGGSKAGRAGLRPLAAALKASTALQELNLSDNVLSSKDAPMLADAISDMGALVKLDISRNFIGDE